MKRQGYISIAAAIIFTGLLILNNFSVQLPGLGNPGQAVELKKMLDAKYVLDDSVDYLSCNLMDNAGIVPSILNVTPEESNISPASYVQELFLIPMLVDLPPPDLA